MKTLQIPELAVVALVGVSSSGKSTFARKHFKCTEILSSDYCRGLVSDNENDQAATKDAFDVLYYIAKKRLAAGKLTIIDATNVQKESRKPIVEIAREYHCIPVAIVFDLPEKICQERNKMRIRPQFESACDQTTGGSFATINPSTKIGRIYPRICIKRFGRDRCGFY